MITIDKLARQYLEAVADKTRAAAELRAATERHLRCCQAAKDLRARLDEAVSDLDDGPHDPTAVVESTIRLAMVGEEMES